MDLVIGEAEQLFASPGSGTAVSNKTKVCDFLSRKKADATAIASGICERWQVQHPLVQLAHTSGAERMRQCESLVRLSSH